MKLRCCDREVAVVAVWTIFQLSATIIQSDRLQCSAEWSTDGMDGRQYDRRSYWQLAHVYIDSGGAVDSRTAKT